MRVSFVFQLGHMLFHKYVQFQSKTSCLHGRMSPLKNSKTVKSINPRPNCFQRTGVVKVDSIYHSIATFSIPSQIAKYIVQILL